MTERERDIARVRECLDFMKANEVPSYWRTEVEREARALGLLPGLCCAPDQAANFWHDRIMQRQEDSGMYD